MQKKMRGQAIVEYLVLVAVVITFSMGILGFLTKVLRFKASQVSANLLGIENGQDTSLEFLRNEHNRIFKFE